MTTRASKNFNVRVTLAKQAAVFARVLAEHDRRVTRVALPGHDGNRYEVVLRHKGSCTVAKCLQDFGIIGMQLCPACERGRVCYHAMAAVVMAAAKAGYSISWCDDEGSAKLLSNLGGTPFRVQSSHGKHSVWGVWKEEK